MKAIKRTNEHTEQSVHSKKSQYPNYSLEMRRYKYSSETDKPRLLNFKQLKKNRHKERVFLFILLMTTCQLFSNEVFTRASDWEHI